jgi:hypothetical protein
MALIALSPYTLSHEKSWTYGRFMGLPTWKRRGIGGCLLSPTLVVDFSSVTFRGQRVRRLRGRRWLSCEGGDGSPPSTHRAYCLAAQLHLAMGACCSIRVHIISRALVLFFRSWRWTTRGQTNCFFSTAGIVSLEAMEGQYLSISPTTPIRKLAGPD